MLDRYYGSSGRRALELNDLVPSISISGGGRRCIRRIQVVGRTGSRPLVDLFVARDLAGDAVPIVIGNVSPLTRVGACVHPVDAKVIVTCCHITLSL